MQESQHLLTKLEAKNLLLKSENSDVSISHHNADSQTAHNEQQVSEIVTRALFSQTVSQPEHTANTVQNKSHY